MCWNILYLYPVYLWGRWGKWITRLHSQRKILSSIMCGGVRERELETGNKNALQKLASLSGEDPTLSWNVLHERNYLWHLLSQRNQPIVCLKGGVIFILPHLWRARYFLDMLQKYLLNNCSRNTTGTSSPGFSLYYLKQIVITEANA